MIDLLDDWSRRYPVVSIEDGLARGRLGGLARALTAASARPRAIDRRRFLHDQPGPRLARHRRHERANAVLVKMNQIGTLTETFEVIDLAARRRMSMP